MKNLVEPITPAAFECEFCRVSSHGFVLLSRKKLQAFEGHLLVA